MSSHREAPQISEDPVADSTDVYAFVSPDNPSTVTLIANYVPLEGPAGGPNFYEFGDDVAYEINIDNDGDGKPNVTYRFTFTDTLRDPATFLYNVGPIESLASPNWNRVQTFDLCRITWDAWGGEKTSERVLTNAACPPCNIGPLSTPDYPALAAAAVHSFGPGRLAFAGQRAEGFYVDLGSIFDLGDLRPFASDHAHYGLSSYPTNGPGVNATKDLNVHSLVVQVPKGDLVAKNPTIGVWTTASRQKVRVLDGHGDAYSTGPWIQVSRLGNPLFNEVLVPLGKKDYWNSQPPAGDKQFAEYVTSPELAGLLPALYPGVFPNLAALDQSGQPRADLEAILLTGIPAGIIAGFENQTGTVLSDMLRLNTSIPPTTKDPSIYGLLGGDPAGFPNGRRVFDDVTAIELRAIAGVTYALVDKSYTPDAAAGAVTDGLTPADLTSPYLDSFPYLGVPHSGFSTPSS